MSFRDLLGRPLPSRKNDITVTYESSMSDLTETDINKLSGNDVEEDNELDENQIENVDASIRRLGTPIIVDEILGDDEVAVFKESTDVDIAADEAYFSERTIIRLDKNAKKRQLKKVAIFAIAKEKKDPLYRKLNTIWKIERNLEAKLFQKYGSKADARVKVYIANAKKSKSSTIKTVINKLVA